MSALDSLRRELDSLKRAKATLLKDHAKHRDAEAKARLQKEKKLQDADKSSSLSTMRSHLNSAKTYERNEISAAKKVADISARMARNDAEQSRKLKSIETAEKQEQQRRDRADKSRRQEELTHARTLSSLSQTTVRHVMVRPPEPEKLRILYLTANPESVERTFIQPDGSTVAQGTWLRTEAEVRSVKKILKGALHRDQVVVDHLPAASQQDLLDGINDHRPHVVHFSGHGGAGGLLFDNGSVEAPEGHDMNFGLLAQVLAATDTPPKLLVLNACDTLDGVEVILPSVPVVIAMSDSIEDAAASVFAGNFYRGIASAQSVASSLVQAKLSMQMAGFEQDADLPTARHRKDVELDSMVLVKVQI